MICQDLFLLLFFEACLSLQTLFEVHKAGIVHRDIRPDNVIICEAQGLVQLVGFGLAEASLTGQSCSLQLS